MDEGQEGIQDGLEYHFEKTSRQKEAQYLRQHNNEEAIFRHLIVIQCRIILEHFTLVDEELLSARKQFFSLKIFYLLLHRDDLHEQQ